MKPTSRLRMKKRVACALAIFSVLGLQPTVPVEADTTLDPNKPTANFQKDGTQNFTPGSVLTLTDTSKSEFVSFFTFDNDVTATTAIDVIATFRVIAGLPNNADGGNRLVINDGAAKSVIAACVVQNGVNGIGLLSQGNRSDPASYPVFVPVDWQAAPVTIRLRRSSVGDAEIVEINGVAPSPRALLTADKTPPMTRAGGSVEFGSTSPEAECTVEYSAFRSERVVNPVAGTLNFTRFRLRDTDSVDRIQFRADFSSCL